MPTPPRWYKRSQRPKISGSFFGRGAGRTPRKSAAPPLLLRALALLATTVPSFLRAGHKNPLAGRFFFASMATPSACEPRTYRYDRHTNNDTQTSPPQRGKPRLSPLRLSCSLPSTSQGAVGVGPRARRDYLAIAPRCRRSNVARGAPERDCPRQRKQPKPRR